MKKCLGKDDLLWNVFYSTNVVDVSFLDRESTLILKSL